MSEEAVVSEIRSVLIPLDASRLLLPNAVVAEVMNYRRPESRENAPDWFLGVMAWRGTSVPVVSFEGLIGGSVVEPGYRGRTIVTNTLNGNKTIPHIGLVSKAIPSLVRVNEENITPSDLKSDLGELIKESVNVNEGLALIPDLDELERRVLEIVSQE